ncbi:MAG: ABC transporter permease subunit [Anaerolineaceae bacterium]|nr:ABC transporter permease subunit [Anaerolineaceae bacterium]
MTSISNRTVSALTRENRPPSDPLIIALWISLLIAVLFWLAPFIFIVFTSLKTRPDLLMGSPFLPPKILAITNYATAWERGNLAQYGLNSLVISLTKVPLGLLVSSLAAFALTRMRFPLQKSLMMFILLGTMIPVQVALGPLFTIILKAGLLNTYLGILLPYIGFGVPYQIFLLRGFFNSIPRELDEAARIDGCSSFGVYRQVILPLALPGLAAVFILDFVGTWNEFAIALVVLQSRSTWTIPLALQSFQGLYGNNYNLLTAAIVMSILPVVIVYLLFQRYFIAGLTSGAIKG